MQALYLDTMQSYIPLLSLVDRKEKLFVDWTCEYMTLLYTSVRGCLWCWESLLDKPLELACAHAKVGEAS